MAHRSRSRTAESADAKKSKTTPRRLTEKIAIMKRREHEQSEAFEKAMKSIFEVCTVHVRMMVYVHVQYTDQQEWGKVEDNESMCILHICIGSNQFVAYTC